MNALPKLREPWDEDSDFLELSESDQELWLRQKYRQDGIDPYDRKVAMALIRVGEKVTDEGWVQDAFGELDANVWQSVAKSLADGDECDAGKVLSEAVLQYTKEYFAGKFGVQPY